MFNKYITIENKFSQYCTENKACLRHYHRSSTIMICKAVDNGTTQRQKEAMDCHDPSPPPVKKLHT